MVSIQPPTENATWADTRGQGARPLLSNRSRAVQLFPLGRTETMGAIMHTTHASGPRRASRPVTQTRGARNGIDSTPIGAGLLDLLPPRPTLRQGKHLLRTFPHLMVAF